MPETTKTIDEVLEILLSTAATPATMLKFLADDAVIEFPYALPDRPQKLTGKQEIVPYFSALEGRIALDEIRRGTVHKTNNPISSSCKGHMVQTGQPFEQKYITVFTFRDGLVVHLQDYWNPFTIFTALGGTISLPKSAS